MDRQATFLLALGLLIAAAMGYVDHSNVELERLEAERRTEARRETSMVIDSLAAERDASTP